MSGGGGGGPSTTTGTTYSSNLPEYAKPYYEELLKQTGKEVYKTDASGKAIGVKEFTPYGTRYFWWRSSSFSGRSS